MLIKKLTTHTTEQQVEVKVPHFSKGDYAFYMICKNEEVVTVRDSAVHKWKKGTSEYGTRFYNEEIVEALAAEETTESEFMAAYDATLRGFENSMFPEAIIIDETGKKY